jgi:probable FeS assembly SUF system protein SufT
LELAPGDSIFPIMSAGTTVKLSRDCAAIQIPVGTEVTLKAATPVDIVQTLGGTYTVHSMGGLFRIDGKDADAIGLSPQAATVTDSAAPQAVWSMLKTCFDPEIPVNIVDLGLVYDMGVEPIPDGGHKVFVKMTLTAPGCGMGPTIARDAQQKILALDGVQDASVEVVWDPPWHQSMISAEGRKIMGLG